MTETIKRTTILLCRTTIIVVNLFFLTALIAFSLSSAHAESSDSKSQDEVVVIPEMVPEVTVETTVKEKTVKKLKKVTSKKSGKESIVTLPGERLTIIQVMEILNTTRNLSGKNLSGLKLVGINLSKCNLKGVDLNHADLERADLSESNLERADLTGTNLKMSNLLQSNMTAAKTDLAIFDGAIWKDGMVCIRGSVGQCREHETALIEK